MNSDRRTTIRLLQPSATSGVAEQVPVVAWAQLEAGTINVALVTRGGLRQDLWESLRSAGMDVRICHTPAALERAAAEAPADVVVVDAEAFEAEAYALTTRLRTTSQAGVVVLVADDRRMDRMLALSLGADHCLAGPVDPHELELHIRNLHRRVASRLSTAPAASVSAATAAQAPWRFDATAWTITTPGGRTVPVSMTDYHLLGCLLAKPGAVVSREKMLSGMTQRGVRLASRNLDMIVSRLRKKVAKASGERLPVRSARGVGYVFAGDCETVRTAERVQSPRQGA